MSGVPTREQYTEAHRAAFDVGYSYAAAHPACDRGPTWDHVTAVLPSAPFDRHDRAMLHLHMREAWRRGREAVLRQEAVERGAREYERGLADGRAIAREALGVG